MDNQAWNVYLHNRKIDTVFFTKVCSKELIKDSLINIDGYDKRIKVYKSKKSYK